MPTFQAHEAISAMNTNPYSVVYDFEERIAEWSGSKYAVATDSCTSAIFLSLMYWNVKGKNISIPKFTYPSVACSIIHSGNKVKFTNEVWNGIYELSPMNIWDGALRFRKRMYEGGLHCLSFHIKKLLPIGRGGMILTDDIKAMDWLRKARFDGRSPVPLLEDNFDMLGWNCYMTTEQAARGIQLFETVRHKELPDITVESQKYPDLSKFAVYTQ